MSSNLCNYITWIKGVKTIKAADLGCVWLFGHKLQSPVCAGLSLRPIDCTACTPALSVPYSAAVAAVTAYVAI